MFKKLVLVQAILLFFQILLYFGCELFQRRIHDVKRPVDAKIPFLPWTVLPYCFWFPLIAVYPLVVFQTDPYSYCSYLMTMVIEIVFSVACYLIYPTSFQRPVPPDGFWQNTLQNSALGIIIWKRREGGFPTQRANSNLIWESKPQNVVS